MGNPHTLQGMVFSSVSSFNAVGMSGDGAKYCAKDNGHTWCLNAADVQNGWTGSEKDMAGVTMDGKGLMTASTEMWSWPWSSSAATKQREHSKKHGLLMSTTAEGRAARHRAMRR